MKTRTRWKKVKSIFNGKRCFSDDIGGFFTIYKVQKCKEYNKHCETPDGSNWHEKKRVFIKTDGGLKYVVPYLWLIFHSVDESGKKYLREIEDEYINNAMRKTYFEVQE